MTTSVATRTTTTTDATITAGPNESYTGICGITTVYNSFQSCAHRVDSLRQDCTNSYGSLTDWPGPCECSYYAQDLACFDEQQLCASQVWTQVDQWFRDGVTSCLGKDKNYQIKAQIGPVDNPFLISGLAGVNATTTSASPQSTSVLATAQATGNGTTRGPLPGISSSIPHSNLSSGAIAGAVVGSILGFLLIALAAIIFLRQAKRKGDAEAEAPIPELHDKDAIIHMKETKDNCHELPEAELGELKGDFNYEPVEADSSQLHELESPKQPRSWFGM